jgi:hypothetical protein
MSITTSPNPVDPLSDEAGAAWFESQRKERSHDCYKPSLVWQECARRARAIIDPLREERYAWQTLASDAIRLLSAGSAAPDQINELVHRYADLFCGEGK